MTHEPTRHFVTLDGRWGPRQVHYRRAGEGPTVLLLHQSPQSSREMVDLMGRWAQHFTVIAPDTAGYGQSDPLGPAEVSIDEFAAALLEFTDAIGLRRFGIYGYHTGATIGVWLAHRAPERVTAVAANGLTQLTEEERRAILAAYLPPLVPSWDGSHLAWLWARMREQAIFFPWHERTAASRMYRDVPPPEWLQAALLEFLRAGDNYAIAYRAAFESRPETVLPGLRVPLLVTAAAGDPLQAHLARLRDLPPTAAAVPSAGSAEALDRLLGHLLAHRGDPAPAPVATRPVAGRFWSRMATTAGGPVHLRLSLTGNAQPLILVHDAGGSSATVSRLADPLLGRRPVVMPDLPGHGASHPPGTMAGLTVGECTDATLSALADLGVTQSLLVGQGAGGCVALEALRRGEFARPRLALIDAPWPDDELRAEFRDQGLPCTEPQWHGGHLLLAWHLLRDGRLFFPWFRRNRTGVLQVTPDLDPRRLQLELRDLLIASGSWQHLLGDTLAYPLPAALQAGLRKATPDVAPGILLAAAPSSAWASATRAAAALAPTLRFIGLPGDPASWLPTLIDAWR